MKHCMIIETYFLFPMVEKDLYRLKTEKEAWTSDDVFMFTKAFKNESDRLENKETEDNRTNIEKYIIGIQEELDLKEYDISLITYLLKTVLLLKESKKEDEDPDLYKSFAYPTNFHKYFAFKLYEGDISAKEFEDYRKGNFEEYRAKIVEWIEKGKYSVLIDRLEKVEGFSTIREFENHVQALFEIGRYNIKASDNYPFGLDYSLISKNLQYPVKHGWQIRLYDNVEQYRGFLFRMLNEPQSRHYTKVM